jgi:hypothetical protein
VRREKEKGVDSRFRVMEDEERRPHACPPCCHPSTHHVWHLPFIATVPNKTSRICMYMSDSGNQEKCRTDPYQVQQNMKRIVPKKYFYTANQVK